MTGESRSGNNPFGELNNARLEEEARREEALRRARPFDGMVTETLGQLVEATGWSKTVKSPLDSSGQWKLYKPRELTRFSRSFELTISVRDDQGATYFEFYIKSQFSDGSGSFPGIDRVPTTKDDLVRALSGAVAKYQSR